MASSTGSSTVAARIFAFQNRPTTSFGSDRTPTGTCPRKQRSLGSLVGELDGANELVEARARLKHVGELDKGTKVGPKKPKPEPSAAIRRRRTNSSVLEELDGLLDTAIGENATHFTTTDSRDTTDNPTTDWPLPPTQSTTSKSPKYASRYFGSAAKCKTSRQRQIRTDSSDTIESTIAAHACGPSIDSNRPRSSMDTDVGHYDQLPSEVEHEPARIEVPKQMQNSKSPVKQRAALFEKLSQHDAMLVHEMPHIHDVRNPAKIRGMWPPEQDATRKGKVCSEFVTSLEKHHLKFHHGKDEALVKDNADSPPSISQPNRLRMTHVPPIPLTLPQLVSPRRRSRPDIPEVRDSFTTVPQTKYNSAKVPILSTPKSDESNVKGVTSYNWPLRWDVFRRSPNASTKESSIEARAEPDHHTSPKKMHATQHRVHDLLVAAQEASKEPTSEPDSDQQEDTQSTPARPLMPGALADTPRGSSAAEKEVASQSSMTPAGAITPSTPRGRHRLQDLEVIRHSTAEEQDDNYKVEQRFALSRSRSRGGGVRVQVEIRSPTASPERGGEHIVILTANVTPRNEQDEGSNGAE